jgi:hypothetical protein
MKIGDLVATEYPCGTEENGYFNINGSTIVKGFITKIRGSACWIEIIEPSHTRLEIGQKIYTLLEQCWEV